MTPEYADTRRRALFTAALLLAGCGTSPPVRLYRLPLAAPVDARVPPPAAEPVWEVPSQVALPEYLDRETLIVGRGDTGVELLAAQRWAEPLRDSVPRLLNHDLALLRGSASVWPAPAPAGVPIERVLRVALLALHADTARGVLDLQARWQLVDAHHQAPPLQSSVELQLGMAGSSADDIVRAHRLALWRLAERIAASGRPGST